MLDCSAAWFERVAAPATVRTIYSLKTDKLHNDSFLECADLSALLKRRLVAALQSLHSGFPDLGSPELHSLFICCSSTSLNRLKSSGSLSVVLSYHCTVAGGSDPIRKSSL